MDLGDEPGVDLCSVPVQMDDITEKLPAENRILFGIEIHVIERDPVAVGNGLISGMHVVHISGVGEQDLGKGRGYQNDLDSLFLAEGDDLIQKGFVFLRVDTGLPGMDRDVGIGVAFAAVHVVVVEKTTSQILGFPVRHDEEGLWQDLKRTAVPDHIINVFYRYIKVKGSLAGKHFFALEIECRCKLFHKIDDRAVCDDDPFWNAGGTGSKDRIERICVQMSLADLFESGFIRFCF